MLNLRFVVERDSCAAAGIPPSRGRTIININVPDGLRAGIPAAAQECPSAGSQDPLLMSGFLKKTRGVYPTDYPVLSGV